MRQACHYYLRCLVRSVGCLTIGCLALSTLLYGCVTVKPVVIDQKTELENQLLGAFVRLNDELVLSSSVRATDEEAAATKLSGPQRETLNAMMTREFLRDDLDELRAKQIAGEAKTGLMIILTKPAEASEAKRVERLISDENQARQVICRRALSLQKQLSEKDLPMVQQIFYRLNRQSAKPGDRVQREDGSWETIAAEAKGGRS